MSAAIEIASEAPGIQEQHAGAWAASVAHGAVWSVLGTGLSYAASLAVFTITGRILGVAKYGEFGILNATTGVLGVFAGLGLGITGTKYVAEHRIAAASKAGRVIGVTLLAAFVGSVFVSLFLVGFAGPIAQHALNRPLLAAPLRLSCLVLVFSTISTTQAGILSGFEAFRSLAWSTALRWVIGLPVALLLVRTDGVSGAVLGIAAVYATSCIMNQYLIQRECIRNGVKVRLIFGEFEKAMLLHFALPAMAGSAVVVPVQWVATAILAHQNAGYSQVGLLTAANNWKALVTFLPVTVASAILPALTSLHASTNDLNSRADGLELANLMNQFALWPIAAATIVMARPIMNMYGHAFGDGYAVFALMVGGTATGYVGNTLGTLITSYGRMWFGAVQNCVFGIVMILITYALAPRYGALAVSLSTAAAYLLLLIGTVFYLVHCDLISGSLGRRLAIGGLLMIGFSIAVTSFPPRTPTMMLFAMLPALAVPMMLSSRSARVSLLSAMAILARRALPRFSRTEAP